eukprot:TRINITY_DN1545_c1_g1_i1.p1 TRINITY_DN1545_c1_g1~~TRINITY_DN1545_c1_g1_i1.p1  ORF type:complete len:615 (+),score=223.18 TRINITY_DN1545_c1_g1_i1:52-1845(+)
MPTVRQWGSGARISAGVFAAVLVYAALFYMLLAGDGGSAVPATPPPPPPRPAAPARTPLPQLAAVPRRPVVVTPPPRTLAMLRRSTRQPVPRTPPPPAAESVPVRESLEAWGGPPPAVKDAALFRRRADGDRVAVAFANAEYFRKGLVQNLVCSWRRLRYTAYVLVAVDAEAAAWAQRLEYGEHLHWDAEYWAGTSGGNLRGDYNTTATYLHFIQRRTRFVSGLLHGTALDIVMTDGDTAWLRDPMEAAEVAGAPRCDAFVVNDEHRGGKGPERVEPVGGFLVVRNNERTRRWYRVWTAAQACLRSREQPALHASLLLLDAALQPSVDRASNATEADLLLCVLPAPRFPTSAHLAMRPGPQGPESQYMLDYGLTDPRGLTDVAVAHANLKWKANKVLWMRQFGWWLWDDDRGKCVDAPHRVPPDFRIAEQPPVPLAEIASDHVVFENAVGKRIKLYGVPGGLRYTVDGLERPVIRELYLDRLADGRYQLHYPGIQKTSVVPLNRTLEVLGVVRFLARRTGAKHDIGAWLKPNPRSIDSRRFRDHIGYVWQPDRSVKPHGGRWKPDMAAFLDFHHSPGSRWAGCAAALRPLIERSPHV